MRMGTPFHASHTTVRQLLSVLSACLLGLLTWANGASAALCFPDAYGVPGLPGPPEWLSGAQVRTELDDPRWAGAVRQSYPMLAPSTSPGTTSEATIRGVVEGNILYLSYQTLVDPAGTGTAQQDSIYLALAPSAAGAAKLLRVRLNSNTNGPAQTGAAYAIEYWEAPSSTGAWAATPPNAGTTAMTGDLAIWVQNNPAPAAGSWAVNLKVDLAALGIASPFLMWSAIVAEVVSSPALYVYYTWPSGAAGPIVPASADGPPPVTPNAMLASDWDTATLGTGGTPCTGGVSIAWNQIGVDLGSVTCSGTLGSTISTTHDNTFCALPTYDGVSTAAGKVLARFRIANWGSIADPAASWNSIPGAEAVPSAADGTISWPCHQGSAPNCPTLGVGMSTHQCMLVELSSNDTVYFSRSSVWRNMDFVATSSPFTRKAEVSIRGAKPLKKPAPAREVYLYVNTYNMPAKAEGPLDQRRLAQGVRLAAAYHPNPFPAPRQEPEVPPVVDVRAPRGGAERLQRAPAPVDKVKPVPAPGDRAAPAPTAASNEAQALAQKTSKTPEDILRETWPTYEVHVYRHDGEHRTFGGKTLRVLESQLPFGYYVNHHGQVTGWSHELMAEGAELEEIAPNFYRLSVKENDAVRLSTVIHADKPAGTGPCQQPGDCGKVEPCSTCRCNCRLVGERAGAGGGLAGAAALLLVAVVGIRRGRRRPVQ